MIKIEINGKSFSDMLSDVVTGATTSVAKGIHTYEETRYKMAQKTQDEIELKRMLRDPDIQMKLRMLANERHD